MSRIRLYLEDLPDTEGSRLGTFYSVRGASWSFFVTRPMVERIERALNRADVPTWIRFTDWAGSRIRVRSCDVRATVEGTPEQRAADRKLARAWEREEQDDKNYD